jgi:hypothetical protein
VQDSGWTHRLYREVVERFGLSTAGAGVALTARNAGSPAPTYAMRSALTSVLFPNRLSMRSTASSAVWFR